MQHYKDYRTSADAHVDKGLLEENDINCVILDSTLSTIYPAPDSAIGRVSLYIEDDKAEQAKSLLND